MAMIPDDGELLTEFERDALFEPYRHYVTSKRHDRRINIETFRPLWDCFMLLDEIWNREFAIVTKDVISDSKNMFPLLIFGAVQEKTRVVVDLCFSGYLAEAYSILRDVVEYVVHGCRLLSRPELVAVWCNRDNDAASLKAWRNEFWFEKESRLFDGMAELHFAWKMCSENASHANISSLLSHWYTGEADRGLIYRGVSPDALPLRISGILQILTDLERQFFERVVDRLKSDADLPKMRGKFREDKLTALIGLGLIVRLADGSFDVVPEPSPAS
jgi:hypothetical protein